MTPVIEVRDLRYRYEDGTEALKGVDFRLHAGESVALFGANGSGKSTFALHLNGLLSGQGSISVCGIEVSRKTPRRYVGRSDWSFRIRTHSFSCRPCWRMYLSAYSIREYHRKPRGSVHVPHWTGGYVWRGA